MRLRNAGGSSPEVRVHGVMRMRLRNVRDRLSDVRDLWMGQKNASDPSPAVRVPKVVGMSPRNVSLSSL